MMIYDRVQPYEVYWCDLPVMTNGISGGRRPCIIVSNERECIYNDKVVIIPMTTQIKRTDLPVNVVINLDRESMAMCNHITTIPKTWLREYIGRLTNKEIRDVKIGLMSELGFF